jgi:glycosyltransferase involved in cell wall biosynthesis
LQIAKKSGISIRIAHSHTAAPVENNLKHKALKTIGSVLTKLVATDLLACGKKAGNFLWNNSKYIVMKNAINLDNFKYDETIRHKIRTQLMVENNFVYGTVGRCSKEKNQLFLIEIHEKLIEHIPNAVLIIIGNGELEGILKDRIMQSKVKDSIIFLGQRKDVPELLMAFDLFVLPSVSEGNPISGIEAISTGVPCIFSKNVTKELKVSDNIRYADIRDTKEWIDTIIELSNYHENREKGAILMSEYDIKKNAIWLEEYYSSLIEGVQ